MHIPAVVSGLYRAVVYRCAPGDAMDLTATLALTFVLSFVLGLAIRAVATAFGREDRTYLGGRH